MFDAEQRGDRGFSHAKVSFTTIWNVSISGICTQRQSQLSISFLEPAKCWASAVAGVEVFADHRIDTTFMTELQGARFIRTLVSY
jgi:hypothetical protein